MDTFGTIALNGTALSQQNLLIGAVWNRCVAFDSYVGLTEIPNFINSQGAFTSELESLSRSTTQLESYSVASFGSLSLSTTSNFASVDSLIGVAADNPLVGTFKSGEYAALLSLAKFPGSDVSDVLDGYTADATITSPLVEATLDLAIATAKKQLESFVGDEEFIDKMNLAFGDDWQPQQANALIEDLVSGEAIPKIEILPATNLKANGAFGEGIIYLSEKFLTKNVANPEAVAGVLLEEIGHYVDQELNSVDSPGDEGDIFARLVRHETINGAELGALKAQDDSGTIFLNGEEIAVELADKNYTAIIPIPSEINPELTSPSAEYLEELLGNPAEPSPELQQLTVTQNVGPFEVTGLKPAVEALQRIFTKIQQENSELYEQLGNLGMRVVRPIAGTSTYSNHSWGAAIDIRIGDTEADLNKDGQTYLGLVELYPYFNAEKFYWGAGFSTNEDPIHFEASKELLAQWEAKGILTAGAEPPDTPPPPSSPSSAPSYPGYLLEYKPGNPLSYDENVKQWQQRMSDLGKTIDVDGLYGPESAQVARNFQQERGLSVDGIVGPQTWEASFV